MTKSATAWRPLSGTGDTSIVSGSMLLQDGGSLLLQDGGEIERTTSSVTPKDDTVWGLTDTKNATGWRVGGSGDLSIEAANVRTTKLGDTRVTVNGDTRVTAAGTYTPKSTTIWGEL